MAPRQSTSCGELPARHTRGKVGLPGMCGGIFGPLAARPQAKHLVEKMGGGGRRRRQPHARNIMPLHELARPPLAACTVVVGCLFPCVCVCRCLRSLGCVCIWGARSVEVLWKVNVGGRRDGPEVRREGAQISTVTWLGFGRCRRRLPPELGSVA